MASLAAEIIKILLRFLLRICMIGFVQILYLDFDGTLMRLLQLFSHHRICPNMQFTRILMAFLIDDGHLKIHSH